MKLKKAIREHAIAIDALALITLHKRSMEDLGWYDDAIDTDLAMARKEYKRTQRQIRAVMVAMQYRSKQTDVMEYLNCDGLNTVTSLRVYDSLFTYMRRLNYGVSSLETKRKLAKRACEYYLQFGDMAKRRYYVEAEYYSFFGQRVSLLEH